PKLVWRRPLVPGNCNASKMDELAHRAIVRKATTGQPVNESDGKKPVANRVIAAESSVDPSECISAGLIGDRCMLLRREPAVGCVRCRGVVGRWSLGVFVCG